MIEYLENMTFNEDNLLFNEVIQEIINNHDIYNEEIRFLFFRISSYTSLSIYKKNGLYIETLYTGNIDNELKYIELIPQDIDLVPIIKSYIRKKNISKL